MKKCGMRSAEREVVGGRPTIKAGISKNWHVFSLFMGLLLLLGNLVCVQGQPSATPRSALRTPHSP